MTDPIADMLTRIRNAYLARKPDVVVPLSRVKESLAKVLVAEQYAESYRIVDSLPQKQLVMTLKYSHRQPVITKLTRISKPGRRQYINSKKITAPLAGHGIDIISTSKGIMTGTDAVKHNLGGEILCRVY